MLESLVAGWRQLQEKALHPAIEFHLREGGIVMIPQRRTINRNERAGLSLCEFFRTLVGRTWGSERERAWFRLASIGVHSTKGAQVGLHRWGLDSSLHIKEPSPEAMIVDDIFITGRSSAVTVLRSYWKSKEDYGRVPLSVALHCPTTSSYVLLL